MLPLLTNQYQMCKLQSNSDRFYGFVNQIQRRNKNAQSAEWYTSFKAFNRIARMHPKQVQVEGMSAFQRT